MLGSSSVFCLNTLSLRPAQKQRIREKLIVDDIIEEQELTVLYKKIQKAKKEKRLAQKKKGKNYKEIEGVKVVSKNKKVNVNFEDQKEKKLQTESCARGREEEGQFQNQKEKKQRIQQP